MVSLVPVATNHVGIRTDGDIGDRDVMYSFPFNM